MESSCINFIEALHRVEANAVQYQAMFSKIYVTTYNGCDKAADFFRDLDKLFKPFKYELQHLSLNYPSKDGRQVFLTGLHQNLLEIKLENEETFKSEIQPNFKYLYLGDHGVLKQFPDKFCKLLHDSKIDYEHHKVHYMYQVQYRMINKAIDLVILNAGNEGKDLSPQEKDISSSDPSMATSINRRAKTPLTLTQLAHFIDVASEAVTDGSMGKSELAEFVSESFETPRSKRPSKRQIYKAFYDVDESTREVVKARVIEMLNRVNR